MLQKVRSSPGQEAGMFIADKKMLLANVSVTQSAPITLSQDSEHNCIHFYYFILSWE